MDWWNLWSLSFLMLFCSSNCQNDYSRRHRWRDRFVPIERYWDLHELPTNKISSAPRFTLLAPDLLRTDSQENVYLQAYDVPIPISVSILIQDFTETTTLLQDSVTLDQTNGFSALKTIQLSSDLLNREEKNNKFVTLKVTFGGYHTEKRVLMVTFHSGYIFIQTDKPIYKPGDTVRLRTFVSSPDFKAFESTITVDIQNPDGVVVNQFDNIRATSGVFADTFPIPEIANEGMWIVTAKFDHWQQNMFTSQFQVKKYVLPAFNVTLTPKKTFLSLDDSELQVEISARYLYGQPVQGTAYVVFGVKINKEMRRLPSVKQLSNLDRGIVTLSMAELRRAYPDIRSLVGNSLYVKASVVTTTGSDLVEAEKSGIKIVESPYVLVFKDMPKYFKPGLPFDFTIQVSHHDGSPAHNVEVKLNLLDAPLVISSGTIRASINMPNDKRPQTITAETTQAGLRPEQQARQDVTVLPYNTHDQSQRNYLHISTGTNIVPLNEGVTLKLTASLADQSHREFIKYITYLVLSKGKIIKAGRLDITGQLDTSIGLTVTPEFMPSFRVVAFYSIPWFGQEEVVSDSIWIDVVDSCVRGLTVGPADSIPRDLTPGTTFRFQIKGDPGAKVSLVAVDNAVYLLNRDRLTQKKIWDVVEHGDIGCTQGGGQDARGVFKDAGLLFSSNTGFQTPNRQAVKCPGSARRRRSAGLLRRKAMLESHYKEKLQYRCCKDGLRDIPMPYSCMRRSLYITDGWECIRAFRYCCATYRDQPFNTEIPTTLPPMTTTPPTTSAPPRPTFAFAHIEPFPRIPLSRHNFEWGLARAPPGPPELPRLYALPGKAGVLPGPLGRGLGFQEEYEEGFPAVKEDIEEEEDEEEWEYLDETEVYLRFKFYESWLWMDVNLPGQAERDGFAYMNIEKPLPDSITEWGVLAVSTSKQTGFCVAEPYNVRAWKRFFVDLKLPYSVARNEQVEIKAVIHNYGSDELHVRVVLMKTEGMCSIAFKDRHTQEVTVPAGSSVAVPYTIVPLVVGKHPLEVMVVIRDRMGGDRIQKMLRVVMDGVQKTEVWSVVLNPSAEGGMQTVRAGKIELESVVPNSEPETYINIRGNVLADSIDNSISEDSLASLIRMPGGCVEQNLASITLPLIATLYLDRSKNWESVGVERRSEAIKYIKRGYENQLVYRRSDGSYPPYRGEGASTWITAYVVKVFSMAHAFIGVDKQQVCDPLLYLVNNKLTVNEGKYVENNAVYTTTMTGGLRGGDPQITLTAFVQIALAEAQKAGISCSGTGLTMEAAIRLTANYLKTALTTTGRRPYTVAIASYALSLLETPPSLHQPLLSAAARGGSHWPDRENHLFTLEATGYALLALIKLGRMEEAAAPFKWLNSQRRRGGGFGSTQSTMVVLQALSEYLIKNPPSEDLQLDVDVRMSGRTEIRYHFNPRTAYAARTSRLPANLDLEVSARGNGQGILEVVTHYNQLHEVDEKKPCQHFELSIAIEESREKPPADVEKSFQLTIKVRALGPRDVRMVVLDISLPTGFTPDNSDLEMLSNSVDRYINNFQIVDNLSDRGSLIIHLFKVSHKEPEILMFRLQQSFKVGLLQPSSVTVYEYYNPDHRCTRTYSPPENKEQLSRICRDNICRCTEGEVWRRWTQFDKSSRRNSARMSPDHRNQFTFIFSGLGLAPYRGDCCVSKNDGESFSNKERETAACKTLHHVFQVKVLSVSQSYYDKYEVEITRVIKLGVETGVETGQTRIFMSQGICRDGLDLKQGSLYLIMGPKEDQWNIDPDTNTFVYVLGKDTWVERWPLPAECSSNPSLQAKCRSLNDAASELSVSGCRV